MEKVILHCDVNNFYASVECLRNPALKEIPVAVAGDPKLRHGVVLAKNELAKKYGVKTGDVVWEAKLKAPGLVIIGAHFDDYMRFSKILFEYYQNFTPQVEPFGADECWLDATKSINLFGSGKELADRIRKEVRERWGLTLSVGVSFSKEFAKLGSDIKKPDATTVISRDNFKTIVYPLPVRDLLYVGKHTEERLQKLNINTIGDLAEADEKFLNIALGKNGIKLRTTARGESIEPIREADNKRKADSIGHGMTAVRDIETLIDAKALVFYLSDLVATRMRKNSFRGYGIQIAIRGNDLKVITRQTKLDFPTMSATEIGETAFKLLEQHWKEKPPMRTLAVAVFDLVPITSQGQLSMFNEVSHSKNDSIENALDKIRSKYGAHSIMRGNLIQTDFIYEKTEDEDFLPFQK